MDNFIIYTLNFFVLGGIVLWFRKSFFTDELAKYYYLALGFKIISGVLLGLLYLHFYKEGDTISYYENAVGLNQLSSKEFWTSTSTPLVSSDSVRAIYFTRLVAVTIWLTKGNYWFVSSYFSLISFFGVYYFVSQFVGTFPKNKYAVILSFLFFPSVVFWSSGLIKESIVFGSVMFLIGCYISFNRNRTHTLAQFTLCLISVSFLVLLKYYIAAILMPLLVYLLLYSWIEKNELLLYGFWKRSFLILLTLAVPGYFFLGWLSPNLTFKWFWKVLQENHDAMIMVSAEGSIRRLEWFDNSLDVVINIFYYFFTGIFRPLLFESLSFPSIVSGIENSIIFGASVWVLFFGKIKKIVWTPELLATILYLSTLALFLSYSTPNFGTMARYKVYYMPFFMLLTLSQITFLKNESKH